MKKQKSKKQSNYDRGRTFVKIMAAILAVLMVSGTIVTIVFALMR